MVRSLLCEALRDDDEELFDLVVSCGGRVDALFTIDDVSMTLMHFAAILNKVSWMKKLALLDVDIAQLDSEGRTPLHVCENRKTYDTLVSLGADNTSVEPP